jgi:hypothetical protein
MKAKKALKRLNRVESILSNVIDQYPASERGLRDLLDAAKDSITRAKKTMNAASASRARKAPEKAAESRQGRLSPEGRRRISLAAKKRWALAKRKGISAVTGRPLSKTA